MPGHGARHHHQRFLELFLEPLVDVGPDNEGYHPEFVFQCNEVGFLDRVLKGPGNQPSALNFFSILRCLYLACEREVK